MFTNVEFTEGDTILRILVDWSCLTDESSVDLMFVSFNTFRAAALIASGGLTKEDLENPGLLAAAKELLGVLYPGLRFDKEGAEAIHAVLMKKAEQS